jgi:hypothetical protein
MDADGSTKFNMYEPSAYVRIISDVKEGLSAVMMSCRRIEVKCVD